MHFGSREPPTVTSASTSTPGKRCLKTPTKSSHQRVKFLVLDLGIDPSSGGCVEVTKTSWERQGTFVKLPLWLEDQNACYRAAQDHTASGPAVGSGGSSRALAA